MRAIRYFGRLVKEFLGFAWQNKAWWIVPVAAILLLLAVLLFATQGALPFIYAIF